MSTLVFKAVAVEDGDQRLVFGLASLAVDANGETITDLQGDQIEPAELEKAFYDYVATSGEGDVDHNQKHASQLVESFVVTPSKLNMLLKACGYKGSEIPFSGVAAWVGFRVDSDDVWKRVKAGELTGFSIYGSAERIPA